MTEETQVSTPESVNEVSAAPAPEATQSEKLLPQSDVNRIVADNKRSSYDKGYQAAVSQFGQEQAQQSNVGQLNADQGRQAAPNQAQVSALDPVEIRKLVADQVQTLAQQQQQQVFEAHRMNEANRIYGELQNKLLMLRQSIKILMM
jgi:hypothetical protein